jgi:flagellar L-ring protein precursor FlgH
MNRTTSIFIGACLSGQLIACGHQQTPLAEQPTSVTVHPRDIYPCNYVFSTKLTDVRLEQQTQGNNRLFSEPGWLTRFFMKVLPF